MMGMVCDAGVAVYDAHEALTASAASVYVPAVRPLMISVDVMAFEYPLGPVNVARAGTLPGNPTTWMLSDVPCDV